MRTYYGGYRTRTFNDIFPSFEDFKANYDEGKIPKKLSEGSLETLYYLLYARYANSHIVHDDENQFKYAVLSTIFMYGPTWEKRVEIQDSLRTLSEEDLRMGSRAIYNHAYNPSTIPSTATIDELPTINDQNTSKYIRGKLEGYANLIELLKTDVTLEFIDRFKRLFLVIVAPDYPLLYETFIEGDEEDE